MKTKLLAVMLLAGSSLFAGPRVFVGVGIGGYVAPPPVAVYAPPPPPAYSYYVPPCPGPAYSWVAGYWYPVGGRYLWRAGYWGRRPFIGARWVAPRYWGHRYYHGYWRR